MAAIELVYMPYLPVDYPSVGLSVLLGGLRDAGLDARVVYANVRFAQQVGLDLYQLPGFQISNHLAEDWTFRDAVYPPSERPPSWAVEGALEYDPAYAALLTEARGKDLPALFRDLRLEALRFVPALAEALVAGGAKIVGASTMHLQGMAALAILRAVKALDPRVVTILGGSGAEAELGVAVHRRYPFLDYVVSGEPDAFFPGFCRALLEAGGPVPSDQVPPGVFHPGQRDGASYPDPPPRLTFGDLEHSPLPDYGDFFAALEAAGLAGELYLRIPMETARGCWYGAKNRCTVCAYQTSALEYRSKSPERVLSEMAVLRERYGPRDLFVVDSVMDGGYFETLLPHLAAKGAPYPLFWETRSNLDAERIDLLRRAGVTVIEAGIESLVDPVLRSYGKGNTALGNVRFLRDCLSLGVTAGWNFLVGAPGEDDAWYEALNGWLPSITHLQPPMNTLRVQFPRFSTYFERAAELGLHLEPLPAYADLHPFDDHAELAFFFREPELDARWPLAPHRKRTLELVRAWLQLYHSRVPPRLVGKDLGTRYEVRDTRPVAGAFRTELSGVDRAVLLATQRIRSPEVLSAVVAPILGRAPEAAEVADSLERLVAQRLVLHLGGRVVALPTKPLLRNPAYDRVALRKNDPFRVFRPLLPHRFGAEAPPLDELLRGVQTPAVP